MIEKKGFLILSFVVYVALYIFLCSIIFYFCSLYFQWTYSSCNQVKALYAYHSIQKKFMTDSFDCIDIVIDTSKIVFCKDTCTITWAIKKNCLIRKEFFHKNSTLPKNIVYLCSVADAYQPFLSECTHNCFLAGFNINFFHCSFTVSTVAQRRKRREKI